MSGYVNCGCRDCFEVAIGGPGDLCHECKEASCDPSRECQRPGAYGCEEEAAPSDWLVLEIADNGPGVWYRFHIEGENLSARPADRRFSWSVRDIADARYAAHPNATDAVKAAVAAAKTVEVR
jgi:hypothetical protein